MTIGVRVFFWAQKCHEGLGSKCLKLNLGFIVVVQGQFDSEGLEFGFRKEISVKSTLDIFLSD